MEKILKFKRVPNGWHTSWQWSAKGKTNRYLIDVDKGYLILFVNKVKTESLHIDCAPLSGESDFSCKFQKLVDLAIKKEEEYSLQT